MRACDDLYCRSGSAISKEADGGGIVLKLPTMAYYGLDEVGVTVWNRLQRPCDIDDVARGVSSEFGVSMETVIGDLKAFLDELLAEGLIESAAGGSAREAAPGFETAQPRTPVTGRRYAAPVLERGMLRNAANTECGPHEDGAFYSPGSPRFKIS
jgi:hypothetical protein